MKAREAREKVKSAKIEKSMLEEIYNQINHAVENNYHHIFIREFNISKDDKESLENDGYLVDTRYGRGFDIRWYEPDKKYFIDLIESNKKHAYLKISEDIIEKYFILQEFK